MFIFFQDLPPGGIFTARIVSVSTDIKSRLYKQLNMMDTIT